MTYNYSQDNLLDKPHSYMYTPFQGAELLQSYVYSRVAFIQHHLTGFSKGDQLDHVFVTYSLQVLERLINQNNPGVCEHFHALLYVAPSKIIELSKTEEKFLTELSMPLSNMMASGLVNTLTLLQALVATQLINEEKADVKVWIDRLVHRFEITKKIYEAYIPGFRKGEGSNKIVRLYWLFALALCLYYSTSKGLKYLSTLLKVCDLLCSLPENMLCKEIPEGGLSVVLAAEIISVQMLAEKKGVSHAFK